MRIDAGTFLEISEHTHIASLAIFINQDFNQPMCLS